MRTLFLRHGCHSCGRRVGTNVADHQPPNKIVFGGAAGGTPRPTGAPTEVRDRNWVKVAAGRHGAGSGWRTWLRWPRLLGGARGHHGGGKLAFIKQRFYPQCTPCSLQQAKAMRENLRILVPHVPEMSPPMFAGVLVGLRHPAGPPPTGGRKASAGDRGGALLGSLTFGWDKWDVSKLWAPESSRR